jgi:VWFA-related protein
LSQSVAGEQLTDLKAAGSALLDNLTPTDQAALLTFSHGLSLGSALTKDVAQLRGVLDDLETAGNTSLFDATYAAMLLGERDPGRDLLVVFSDGRDTASWLSADQVVDAAKRSEIVAYGLTLRGSASGPFLRRLADETGGESFEIDSTRVLPAQFLSILEGFRHRYLVSYSPTGVARSGWHRLEVKVKGRRATVRARSGYFER